MIATWFIQQWWVHTVLFGIRDICNIIDVQIIRVHTMRFIEISRSRAHRRKPLKYLSHECYPPSCRAPVCARVCGCVSVCACGFMTNTLLCISQNVHCLTSSCIIGMLWCGPGVVEPRAQNSLSVATNWSCINHTGHSWRKPLARKYARDYKQKCTRCPLPLSHHLSGGDGVLSVNATLFMHRKRCRCSNAAPSPALACPRALLCNSTRSNFVWRLCAYTFNSNANTHIEQKKDLP